MREFRPPIRTSKVRSYLAVFLVLLVLLPAVLLLWLSSGTRAMSYQIEGGELRVRSGDVLFGEKTLKLSSITEARVLRVHRGKRTAGTAFGGFCAGHFSFDETGPAWIATDCREWVLLVRASTEDKPILISPPDPDAFRARLTSGEDTFIQMPPPDTSPLLVIGLTVIPVALLTSLAVSALLIYGPRKMLYRVGKGELEIRTLFGKKRLALRGVRVREYSPSKLWRLAGTAVPGYMTGIYREGGKTTRVYATDTSQCVLLEGEPRVLLSPEDRVGFLEALAAQGAEVEHGGRSTKL